LRHEDDPIPVVEIYRGVGLHEEQPPERIEHVKAEIDAVHALDDVHALATYAEDVSKPPEARLLAAAKIEAAFALAAEARWTRPAISLERVQASVAGLNSRAWRDPFYYGSLGDVCPPGENRRVRREPPLIA
jgi:hypothetical protein